MQGLVLPFLLWLLITVAYIMSPVVTSFDSRFVVLQAVSLLRHGDLNLDEYRIEEYQHLFEAGSYSVHRQDAHYYSIYPAGVPVLAAPIIWLLSTMTGVDPASSDNSRLAAELITASVIAATAALAIYAVSYALTSSTGLATLACIVFAFGTPAWSTASRGLWQHGPSLLLVSLAILFIIRSDRSPRWLWLCGFSVAAAYAVRPANIVVVIGMTIYVALRHTRPGLLAYICGAAPVAAAFVAYNVSVYSQVFSPYYMGYAVEGSSWYSYSRPLPSAVALAGHLVSPKRGLLVYSPVFLICIYSWFRKFARRELSQLDVLAVAMVLGLWILISTPRPWWGGACYGPRLFSEAVPWLVLLMVSEVNTWEWRSKKATVLTALVLISIFTHFRGATDPAACEIGLDENHVWSWARKDIPFLHRIVVWP
jgi:hypothetical protein